MLQRRRPNQSPEPTAGRSKAQLSDDFNVPLQIMLALAKGWLSSVTLGGGANYRSLYAIPRFGNVRYGRL